MGHMNNVTVDRLRQIDLVATAISEHYDTEGRIQTAQYEQEFEDGIKVALDVMAEFVADLHNLVDYHGQDWDALLLDAQLKYQSHKEAVAS